MTREHFFFAVWLLATILIPTLWIISLLLQAKTFKRLSDAVEQIQFQLSLMSGPSHCGFCGATLQAGTTQHKPDCEINALINKHFPEVH